MLFDPSEEQNGFQRDLVLDPGEPDAGGNIAP